MTTPDMFATMWAIMRPEAIGYQFLRVQKTQGLTASAVQGSRTGIPLPEGTTMVMIDWSGSSALRIQVRKDGTSYLTKDVLSATYGTPRMLSLRLPIESTGHTLDITGTNLTQEDLDKARCGVQIIPAY